MRAYKNIQFGEGIKCTLTEFKKKFSSNLVGLSEKEVKEAHKVATKGNGNVSRTTQESKETNSEKSK